MKLRDPNALSINDDIAAETIDWESEGPTSQQREEALNPENEIPTDPAVDSLNQQGYQLEITSVHTGLSVTFPAFLTQFEDTFSSSWSTVEAYGRMDTMPVYQNTRRSINLGWDVPSFSITEAKNNLRKLAMLEKFLYPEFDSGDLGATTIKTAPLFRIKFANLIMNADNEKGLLGYINGGFSTSPDVDQGFHMDKGKIYPKLFSLSVQFTVLHEHSLGWENGTKFRGGAAGFPYGQQDPTTNLGKTLSQEKNEQAPDNVRESRNNLILE